MRKTHRLKLSDVRNIQKNVQVKTQKQAYALMQLMDLPDFDTSEFFQTLLKSERHEEVLEKIPIEKKIDFFSKNYLTFLQTQDELLNLSLPKLQTLPKAKQFVFDMQRQEQKEDNFDESSVLEIMDSFSAFVLQKNLEQAMRVYQIIQEMKKHSKYKVYFNQYSTNKIFLETYNSFIESCTSSESLLQINQYEKAIQVYLTEKQEHILGEIKVNLNVNDSADSIGKEMSKLVHFVEKEVNGFKFKFKKEISKNDEINAVLCEWIRLVTKNFYLLIESYVYEKEELSDILEALSIVLEASVQLQSKGITLQRQMKQLIAVDLPLHISKVIEIIVDSINETLKQNNELYEFVFFASIKNFSSELSVLKPIGKQDFGLKCATCKGIILVNSFILILSNLCDDKWAFLHEGAIDILLNKVALNILNCTLHYWDYYFIYLFFERLAAGKIRHKELFSGEAGGGLKQKLGKIKSLSENSWNLFESKLLNEYWKQILMGIPGQLYSFKKYGYFLEKHDLRPSPLSLSLVFKLQEFFKQIQFRLSTSQFQYLTFIFFEFIIYTFEYVLFWSYHSKGTNDKVFILYNKQEKLLKKIKEYNFLEIQEIKQENILKLSKLNKFGFTKLVFEVYFLTEVIKVMTRAKKVECDQFISRLSKILAKDQKSEPMDVSRPQFQEGLAKMIKIYQQKPELMQNYLTDRKKA